MASRQFSIPTVLRMVPNELLGQVFERLGHGGLGIDWKELKEREIEPVLRTINALPRCQRMAIETTLRSLFELGCETGIQAIIEAAIRCGEPDLAQSMPRQVGPYAKATWAWLHRREAFDKAVVIHQVDNLTWWRKRRDLPRVQPDTSPNALDRLARSISGFLLRTQGRGQACTVEHFARADGVDYFFAHPDDFVQSVTIHDEQGQLTPQTQRQTFVMVFAYCREDGTLELFARVPGKLKSEIEKLFCETILTSRLADATPAPAYELDQLKDPSFDLATDPEDQVRVYVRRMRLDFSKQGRRILLEVPDSRDSIHEMIQDFLSAENVSLEDAQVTLASFTFEFLPMEGRRPGTLTFDIAWPSHCSLRNQRPERIDLALKYLKRWNIDVGRSRTLALKATG